MQIENDTPRTGGTGAAAGARPLVIGPPPRLTLAALLAPLNALQARPAPDPQRNTSDMNTSDTNTTHTPPLRRAAAPLLLLALLAAAGPGARAGTTLDYSTPTIWTATGLNNPMYDGSHIDALGQTFTTGPDAVLQDFTFYQSSSAPIDYSFRIAAWDGSAPGQVLFSGDTRHIDSDSGDGAETYAFGRGLQLQAGRQYVALLSLVSAPGGGETYLSTSYVGDAYNGPAGTDYTGGYRVFHYASGWEDRDQEDLAFRADFTRGLSPAATAAPEPPGVAAFGLCALGVAGRTLRARRRRAAARLPV